MAKAGSIRSGMSTGVVTALTGALCTRSKRPMPMARRWRDRMFIRCDVPLLGSASGWIAAPGRRGAAHYHPAPRARPRGGADIDVDAAVEARVELLAGSAPDEAVYMDNLRRRRDLAVLILLDVSGSVAEAGTFGQTVHEQQRAAASALTIALHELGDRVALYAFQSQGR